MAAQRKPVATDDQTEVWALADLVTRLRRVLRSSVRSEFPWERLPMAQVEILQRLAEEPGLRVRDIATRHRLASNTVSNLIQQMVVAGLVRRDEDPRDRRAVTVEITDLGREQLNGWLQANSARLDAALAELSPKDRREIVASLPALLRLVQILEESEAQALPSS